MAITPLLKITTSKMSAAWACALLLALVGCAERPQQASDLYIDGDDNLDSLCAKVEVARMREGMWKFRIYAYIYNLEETMRTGRYRVTPETTMRTLAQSIRSHTQNAVRLVVPAPRSLDVMAGRLARPLMADSAEIAAFMADSAKIASLGYTAETLPALFIPNTYEVYWDTSVENLFKRLKRENDTFWNAARERKLAQVSQYAGMPLTREDVATLASIVDSETAVRADKARVAGLFLNRLRIGMHLQSCPTVIFATGDFTIRRVLNAHLATPSPYNTYLHAGLPPGPIRVASIDGIDAVLNFEEHNYLYMCATPDFSGAHLFASTYGEHQRNAARYARELNRRGIK